MISHLYKKRLGSAAYVRGIRAATIVAIGLCGTGCTSNPNRFIADFEADIIGQQPNPVPPGPPSEQIIISDSVLPSENPSTVTVEAAPAGSEGAQALTIAAGGEIPQVVIFLSDLMTSDDRRIFIQWQQTFTGSGGVRMFFGDSNIAANTGCSVETVPTAIALSCEGAGDSDPLVVTGFSPFEPHTVTMTLIRDANITAFAVTQNGVGAYQNRPALNSTAVIPHGSRLRTQINFLGSGNSALYIDQFTVTERY